MSGYSGRGAAKNIKLSFPVLRDNLEKGQDIAWSIYLLKMHVAPKKLRETLDKVLIGTKALEMLHGPSFPRAIEKMYGNLSNVYIGSLESELIIAISSAELRGGNIRDFVSMRRSFEEAILKNEKLEAVDILNRVEKSFGWSVWLIQGRLAAAQLWDGIDEKRKLARAYRESAGANKLVKIIINFVAKRSEGTAVPGFLQSELDRLFKGTNDSVVHSYLKVKLLQLASPDIELIALALAIEAVSNSIDYYETLIAMLQAVVTEPETCEKIRKRIADPVGRLYRKTGDDRLVSVLVALGVKCDWSASEDRSRAEIIEAYSVGNYDLVLTLSNSYLRVHPADMAIVAMQVQTEQKIGHTDEQVKGLWGEIKKNLAGLVSLNDNTYVSALSLYTIADRFYGHPWANYLRAFVNQTLTQDQLNFPSVALRRTLVLSSKVTPFSMLLEPPRGSAGLAKLISGSGLYPATNQVYELATTGKASDLYPISSERTKRYLARYQIANGQWDEAIENLKSAQEFLEGADAFRCSIHLAIAYARKGDLEKAVEATVKAYIKWPTAPTVLPLQELIGALDDPTAWPQSIYIPIVFEIFTRYCSEEKITHLRYAFEVFQLQQDITSPQALKALDSVYGLETIVLYLERVWRPEVMRQTILYDGTKEIEEERIRVCRALVEFDTTNSAQYVTEIRERVKAQELAKATKLVDQSRVYVDIGAIKSSLKSRLGDAYRRYKSAIQSAPHEQTDMLDTIAEKFVGLEKFDASGGSLSNILSSLHLLDEGVNTELSVQFAAMFAEVTNEFLRGNHGLNAYLSTRVRHGKMSNALRKSIVDEHLVTARKEGTTEYVPNNYWADSLTSLTEDEKQSVLSVLENFAKKIDEIISFLKDELIQVAVYHEFIPANGNNPHALFTYQTSNLERLFMQGQDREIENLDGFIDLCVESLWEKTDANLSMVRGVLNSEIKERFLNCFEVLIDDLTALSCSERLSELFNHIARAKTSIQTKIVMISSWFRRSEVYDRADYSVDLPVYVARSMVESTISGSEYWAGVNVSIMTATSSMPGRTLDSIVDIFCAIFENAISYSGKDLAELDIKVELDFDNGRYRAVVINGAAVDSSKGSNTERLEQVRLELRKSDISSKVQSEGRSGFHKIWAAINSPQYSNPDLQFGYNDDDQFVVSFSFSLEVSSDEDSAD